MKILDKEDAKEYTEMIDNVAILIFKETCSNLKRLNEQNPTFDINKVHEEIGSATGQVVLDEIISLTKDMDKEKLTRFFGEAMMAMLVSVMNANPLFMARIRLLSML